MKNLLISGAIAVVCGLALPGHAQIFSQNFDAQVTGATVAGFTAVTPSTPADRGAVIIDDGLPNKALHMYDNDTTSSARVEQDFLAQSSVHLSLDFRRNADLAVNTSTESTRAFYVTLGYGGLSQGTQANRVVEVRLFNNGMFRINRAYQDANGNFVQTDLDDARAFEPSGTLFSQHSLDIFLYSGLAGGTPLTYSGPDSMVRLLDPNSMALFIDGVFIAPTDNATANGNYGVFQTSFYGADNNIGRFGFVTGGAGTQVGHDFIVDNVVLSQITIVPEPSALALALLGGLALAWKRKEQLV